MVEALEDHRVIVTTIIAAFCSAAQASRRRVVSCIAAIQTNRLVPAVIIPLICINDVLASPIDSLRVAN